MKNSRIDKYHVSKKIYKEYPYLLQKWWGWLIILLITVVILKV